MVNNFRESDENIKYNMIQNPVTGKAEQTFRTPYTLQHKIGGLVQVSSPLKRLKDYSISFQHYGMKFSGCYVLNSCKKRGSYPTYNPSQPYM